MNGGAVAPPFSLPFARWRPDLRERAVSDPRAAEIRLRWLQRGARTTHRVDLDAMSEGPLEHLHAGLVKLALLDDTVLAALLEQVLADDELASSS